MIFDSGLVFYSCVYKETTIIAEFNSGDSELDALALKCIENTPPHHSVFSQTLRRRTCTFLIENPFAYFAIFSEDLERMQGLKFLNCIKERVNKLLEVKSMVGFDGFTSHCLQAEIYPVYQELLVSSSSENNPAINGHNASIGSSRGSRIGSVPLLGRPEKGLKKKKRLTGENSLGWEGTSSENRAVEMRDNGVCITREFSVSMMNKTGLFGIDVGQQRSNHLWRQYVVIVLVLDMLVCLFLFGIWLCICRGFGCLQ